MDKWTCKCLTSGTDSNENQSGCNDKDDEIQYLIMVMAVFFKLDFNNPENDFKKEKTS